MGMKTSSQLSGFLVQVFGANSHLRTPLPKNPGDVNELVMALFRGTKMVIRQSIATTTIVRSTKQ